MIVSIVLLLFLGVYRLYEGDYFVTDVYHECGATQDGLHDFDHTHDPSWPPSSP